MDTGWCPTLARRRAAGTAVRALACVGAIAIVTSCGRDAARSPERSQEHPPATAAPDAACTLLSDAEIGAAVRAAVEPGRAIPQGRAACRWTARGAEARSVTLVVVDLADWRDAGADPRAVPLDDLGRGAFVAPWLDDQRAGARAGAFGVYVLSARRDAAVDLLRRAVHRLEACPSGAPTTSGRAEPSRGWRAGPD